MKFLFCTKKCWPGVKTSLNGIAKIIEGLYPDAEIVHFDIPDGTSNRIFREMRDVPPDFAVFGGWNIEIRNAVQLVDKNKTKIGEKPG